MGFNLLQSIRNNPVIAGFIIVAIIALYGGGQEIVAQFMPHDDYYFILRSSSFRLRGDYHAPIKEYLYSLFIGFSRVVGLSLRNAEVICYGLGLSWLWYEVCRISKSDGVAWMAILPLTVFDYQHPIFKHATYDALQLILSPLTFASTLQIVRRRGDTASLVGAGLVAGFHTLTRPEGFLFLGPPLVSLVFVSGKVAVRAKPDRLLLLRRVALVCVIPVALQQGMSAVNRVSFGFWAPTIIKSVEFQRALSALMSIKPVGSQHHGFAPFPKASMERAYMVSPQFRKAKPFFDNHIDGRGWSKHCSSRYTTDGSICGGAFQWALLDASKSVEGPKAKAMLAYLKTVSDEIELAFREGKIEKRRVLSTALGPEFSIMDRSFWSSFLRIGVILLNAGEPRLPSLTRRAADPQVEEDYDRLTLRRTALLDGKERDISGWLVNPALGLPRNTALDQAALRAGSTMKFLAQSDGEKAVLRIGGAQMPLPKCSFDLHLGRSLSGSLTVEYDGHATAIPLARLSMLTSGKTYDLGGIHVHIDHGAAPKPDTHFALVRQVSVAAHHIMKAMFIVSGLWLVMTLLFKRASIPIIEHRTELIVVGVLALSVVLPRLGLLAAIDSHMYPGDEPRYLASAAFSLWVGASFVFAYMVRDVRNYISSHFHFR